MLGKIIVGIAATIIAAEIIEVGIKYKAWRYWDKALEEIPWPVR